MTGEKTDSGTVARGRAAAADAPLKTRGRSTIAFPYGDLDDAVNIARTIYKYAGMGCTTDQLAGWMGQTTTSGAFRGRLSTGRTFGVIETEHGEISLTPLGRRLVDPIQERDARVVAFLEVPLYKAVYEKFGGRALPPPASLERNMASLGVSSKQTDKARQAFERSAEQAGFFEHGNDRLIMPLGARQSETSRLDGNERLREKLGTPTRGGDPRSHPFIQGLFQTLPEPDSEWPVSDRAKWLRTAADVFDLIYKGEGSIKIDAAGKKS